MAADTRTRTQVIQALIRTKLHAYTPITSANADGVIYISYSYAMLCSILNIFVFADPTVFVVKIRCLYYGHLFVSSYLWYNTVQVLYMLCRYAFASARRRTSLYLLT